MRINKKVLKEMIEEELAFMQEQPGGGDLQDAKQQIDSVRDMLNQMSPRVGSLNRSNVEHAINLLRAVLDSLPA